MAEEALLGHALPGGWSEDFSVWRRGVALTDAGSAADMDGALGCARSDVVRAAREFVGANTQRIDRLAAHLATLEAPTVMPHDEVVAFLGQQDAARTDRAEGQ
jgi:hypothetical protein